MSAQTPNLAGVMGWPVGHSLSPKLHGHWIAEHGLDAHYVPLAVEPQNLAQALLALPALGFRGVNLTIPHKEMALQTVREIDPAAALIGAINTVVIDEGKLTGRNTDAIGYAESLREAGVSQIDGHAIVLGAGGAARAVVFALHSMGVHRIVIANRTRDRAEALKRDAAKLNGLEIDAVEWDEAMKHGQGAGLLVNTTALGMLGKDTLEIDLAKLSQNAIVSDIVYRPLRTPLLAQAAARGHRTVEGLGMLLHQAVPAFEAWFGIRPSVTPKLRQKLEAAVGGG
jgi:shikimate dehydrogenase